MSILYKKKDIKILEKNIDKIISEARKYELNNIDPTLKEYLEIKEIILDFIKENDLIVYNLFGIDLLIKDKDKSDGIYTNSLIEQPKIHCYTNKPYLMMKKICNILNNKYYDFVEGRSIKNNDQYAIYTNLLNYLVLSYMPINIIDKIKTIKINNIKCLDPYYIYIDHYKIFNSLLINNHVFKDYIESYEKLLKHYPLEFNSDNIIKIKYDNNILNYIRKNILINSKLVSCGYFAYYYYLYKGSNKEIKMDIPFYDIISLNYNYDIKIVIKKLLKFNKNIVIKKYNPLFNYLGERTSFYLDNKLILNVYDQNMKCIPINYIKQKKIYVCSFSYLIMFCMINIFKSQLEDNKNNINNYNFMIKNIIQVRNIYFKKHNKTLLDDTPFKEFNINCLGKTITDLRDSLLLFKTKIDNKEILIIRYNPNDIKQYSEDILKIKKNDNSEIKKFDYKLLLKRRR